MAKEQWVKVLKGVVCQTCANDQIVDVSVNELGDADVTCEDGHVSHHAAPLPVEADAVGRIGLLLDLGVYDTLAGLFTDATEPYREHGIVEHPASLDCVTRGIWPISGTRARGTGPTTATSATGRLRPARPPTTA